MQRHVNAGTRTLRIAGKMSADTCMPCNEVSVLVRAASNTVVVEIAGCHQGSPHTRCNNLSLPGSASDSFELRILDEIGELADHEAGRCRALLLPFGRLCSIYEDEELVAEDCESFR